MKPTPALLMATTFATLICTVGLAWAQRAPSHTQGELGMQEATGSFAIQMTPAPGHGDDDIGRFGFTKTFAGHFEGKSVGQMLAIGSAASVSGAYVAVEWLSGRLDGREGRFALQHTGSKDASGMHMDITVVPDSGTGALTGIKGRFEIVIEQGQHHYRFHYTLPPAQP